MKKISLIIIFSVILILCVGSITYADAVSFTVDGQAVSFDTGNGEDGDVEFKADGMYVNGVKKCNPNTVPIVNAESFESGFTYWKNVSTDGGDWTQNSGKTPSRADGYSTGASGSSDGTYYVYTEADGNYNKTFILESIDLNTSGEVSFYYHMYGSGMGSLYLEGYNGSTWTILKTITGNQANSWISSGDITFTSMQKLRFRGVIGYNRYSDICLDNIKITTTGYDKVTIFSDQFESVRNNITYNSVYIIEDVVKYLPVNTTYAPSMTEPGKGTVPKFKNLTIDEGVVLKSHKTTTGYWGIVIQQNAINFCVKENLAVKGLIMTNHGNAGGNGLGPILISASEVAVSPDGSTASTGAIMSGWGGGGNGGYVTSYDDVSGNSGGNSSSVIIYANKITNNGEVRAGNGGGGGGGASHSTTGGNGGSGGSLTCASKLFSGNGVYASGFGGGGGSGYYKPSDDYKPGMGGYGGGGNGGDSSTTYEPGKSANNGIIGYGGYTTTIVYGGAGSAGGAGQSNGGTGGTNGTLSILSQGDILGGNFIVGYTSAGGVNGSFFHGTISQKGKQIRIIKGVNITCQVPLCNIHVYYNNNGAPSYNNDKPDIDTTIKGTEVRIDSKIKNNYVTSITADKVIIDGEIVSCRGDDGEYGRESKPISIMAKDIIINSAAKLTKASATGSGASGIILGDITFGTKSAPANSFACYTDINTQKHYVYGIDYYYTYIDIYASGEARLSSAKFKDDTWCKEQRIYINEIPVRAVMPSASPNAAGVNEVDLSDWIAKYNVPSGTNPSLSFIIEKKVDGETNWTASNPFERNLSGKVTWQDTNTVEKKDTIYIVGFKKSGSSFGYVFFTGNSATCMSEGGIGVSNTYNGESAAYWAYQNATKVFNLIIRNGTYADCVYDDLIKKEDRMENGLKIKEVDITAENGYTIGKLTAKVNSFGGIPYTKIFITVTNPEMSIDPSYPIAGAVLDDRLILFKLIAPPTLKDIATITFN